MKTQIPKHLITTAAAAVFTAMSAQAQTVLFRDDFTRTNSADINASDAGQSGVFAPLDWGIKTVNGTTAIDTNELRLDATDSDGNSGAFVYPDKNFIGLTSLTVTMQISSGASSGDGRATGFGIGYTKGALDGKTSVSNANQWTGADVYIGFDNIGTTKSVFVREDGTNVFSKAIPSPAYPVEYKIVFNFADTNDGTAITYEVFENGSSVDTGSTTWTGTDQNYIAFASNYTSNCDINFIEIAGTLLPAAEIVKANNTDDLNLGSSWVGGIAPASGELAIWDNTVTGPNSTVLGGDVTWGGITIQNPAGHVTIGGANTLTLNGIDSAINLGTAMADLTLNANLALEGSEIWTVASGRTITAGGVISGTKGIDKQGDGKVILSGANTYAGSTSVTSGTLQLGASDVIPNGFGAGNLSVAGTLDLNGNSDTINGLSGAGVIDNTADSTAATLTVGDNGQSGTFSGVLQNTGTSATLNFGKIGTGTMTLASANTYSGTTAVTGGTLQVSHASALGNTSGVSLAGGTAFVPNLASFTTSAPFTLGTAGTTSSISVPIDGGTMTLNGVISGDGDLVITDFDTFGGNSTGIILLGAANTYTGTTTIATGDILGNNTTVRSGVENALPTTTVLSLEGLGGQGSGRSVTFDLNGNNQTLAGLENVPQFDRRQVVTSTDPATLTVNNAVEFSFGGVGTGTDNDGFARIQGAISLVKSGAGIFSLAGANTNTGNTTITEGELRIGNGGTTGSLNSATDITIASEATFAVNRSNAVVQGTDFSSNPLTGDGNFAQRGTGTTTLNLANTYNGTTTVDAGALVVVNAGALGTTTAGTVVNGTNTGNLVNARLDLSGGVTVNGEALTIKGVGNFTGALTSSIGSNVWAGPVTIGAAGTRLGASAGASLEISGVIDSGVDTHGLVVRTSDLTGLVILSGANTYLGTTQVLIGKLQLAGGDNRLPLGTILNLASSAANPGAEFDLNGTNQQVAGLALSGSADPTKNSINNSSGTPSTLTVNTPAATPSTFAGILTGNLFIAKTGPDTLSLTGTSNVYTGNTTVNEGTLSLGGINTGNESSTVTIAATGATLALDFIGTDTVDKLFIGATQMAAGVYGPSATPLAQIPGTGTLTVTSGPIGGGGYAAWSGGAAADADSNNDGVTNAVAWALGAADVNENAIGLLPDFDNTTNPTYALFTFQRSDAAEADPNTSILVEYGDDLSGWTPAVHDGDDVIITVDDQSPNDEVTVQLKRSTLAPGDRLFARLRVVVTP